MSRKSLAPFKLLRNDRDDHERAIIFDSWLFAQPLEVRNTLEWWLFKLVDGRGLSEIGAKSLLASLISYVSLHPDQQDLWNQHGEYIRSAFEWSVVAGGARVEAA